MMPRGPLSPIVCRSNTTVRAHQDHYDAEGPTFPSFPLLYAVQTQQCVHTRITMMPRGPLSPPFPYCMPIVCLSNTTVRAHQDHYDAEGPTFPSFPLLYAGQTQQCVHTRITMMPRGPLSPIVCSSNTTVRAHQDHYDAEGPTFPYCMPVKHNSACTPLLSPIVCLSNTTVRAHQDHYDAEGPTFPSFPLLYAVQTQQCVHTRITMMPRGPFPLLYAGQTQQCVHTRITMMPRGPLSPPFPYCMQCQTQQCVHTRITMMPRGPLSPIVCRSNTTLRAHQDHYDAEGPTLHTPPFPYCVPVKHNSACTPGSL